MSKKNKKGTKQLEWFGNPTDKPSWWNKLELSEREQDEVFQMRQNLKNQIMALTLKQKMK